MGLPQRSSWCAVTAWARNSGVGLAFVTPTPAGTTRKAGATATVEATFLIDGLFVVIADLD
jgi:hypothetical protein